jgi:hypothetical protein
MRRRGEGNEEECSSQSLPHEHQTIIITAAS